MSTYMSVKMYYHCQNVDALTHIYTWNWKLENNQYLYVTDQLWWMILNMMLLAQIKLYIVQWNKGKVTMPKSDFTNLMEKV